MFGSNRNLIVALGLASLIAITIGILTWPFVPTLQSYSYENPRDSDYTPGGSQCQPAALAAIRDVRKRASEADTCREEAEEYRLNTNDLIQQSRAADAAEAQAHIASQGLWTAWFQTLGGFITLCAAVAAAIYARDAAKEGRNAATAAERQVHLMTDAQVPAIALEMAGLSQSHEPGEHRPLGGPPTETCYANLRYRSSGTTPVNPALLRYGYGANVEPEAPPNYPHAADFHLSHDAIAFDRSWAANILTIDLDDEQRRQIADRQADLWIWVRAEFRDFLGGKIAVGSLLRWEFEAPPVGLPAIVLHHHKLGRLVEVKHLPAFTYNLREKPE